MLKAGQDVVSAAWFISRKILSVLYLAAVSPGHYDGIFQLLTKSLHEMLLYPVAKLLGIICFPNPF